MKKNQALGAIVILVVVAGGSFYAGKSTASTAAPARGAGFAASGGPGFMGRPGGRGAGGGIVLGTIVSTGNGSISIQQQNGSSTEIVLLSPSTQIFKQVAGAASDLATGSTVTITGTPNSDGSMTATSIQIRPARAN